MVNFNKLFGVGRGGDKIAHAIAGFVLAVVTFALVAYGVFDFGSLNLSSSTGLVTVLTIVIAAVGKELVDLYIRKTKFDFFDMFATILGGWSGIFAVGFYFSF